MLPEVNISGQQITKIGKWGPEYSGAERNSISITPAGFIRYGRITISGAGGFTTRRSDDVERGVAASLVERRNLRVNLALRFDNGRSESNSDDLAGMGDISSTVRARLLVRWMPDDLWTLAASSSVDLLGKHGGYWVDVGVNRQWRLTPSTKFGLGAVLTYAGDQYLQTWYGVTPEQSARTGYPVYTPAEGPRDVAVNATLRTEFNHQWAGFVSAGASRLLGGTLDSPLVKRPNAWTVGGGLVWRF